MSPDTPADPVDLAILALLQDDGRRSVVDIAKQVSLSPTAVKRRIQQLEDSGVIAGYSARVDYSRLGWTLEAFIELRFTGNTSGDEMDELAAALPEARAVYTTAGHQDVLVLVTTTGVEHLREVINRLRRTAGIVGTRTHVILGTHVKESWRPLPVD
ncbi:MAG TPA: Lrp/AsnC family transcriptional regulator [Solirubrobacterales bacterium]